MKKANKWFLCEENQTLDLKTHSVRRSLSFMLRSARLLCFVSVATISHERSEKVDFKVEPATWCQSPEEIPQTYDFLKLSKRPFCFCFFFLLKLSIFVPFCVNVANRIVRLDEKDLSIASLILPFRSVLLGRWSKLRVNDKLLCKSSYLTISKCHGGASVTNY